MENSLNDSFRKIGLADILPEVEFTTSRSGGPGGQNVNKVNSKVTARFDIPGSRILTEGEKEFLLSRLSSKATVEGVIVIAVQESRSQLENKETATAKLEQILRQAYVVKKKRKKTKPSKAAKQKRIESKKKQSEKKKWRQKL